MGCTIDHLQVNYTIRVLADFTDLRGATYRMGATGVVRKLEASFVTPEFSIEWERDGKREAMFFSSSCKTGPGIGRMKQFFEKLGYVPVPYDPAKAPKRPTPEVVEGAVFAGLENYQAALNQVWALAARKRFDEARVQMRAISDMPLAQNYQLLDVAEDLTSFATAHADDADRATFAWLREEATNFWYAWGSTATSGGEGAERMLKIGPAMKRFEELERRGTKPA